MIPPGEFEFEKGIDAIRGDRLVEAEQWFTNALRRNPDDHDACERRAYVRMRMGRLAAFARDYGRSLAGLPDCGVCLEGAADVAVKRRRLRQAESFLDQAIRLDPANTSFLYDRGCVRLSRKRLPEAVADFSRVAAFCREGRRMIARVGRARARALLDDLDSALRDLDQAVRMRAGVEDNHFYRGLVRFLSKDTKGALKDLAAAKAPRGLINQFKRPSAPGVRRAKDLLIRDLPYKSRPV